MVAQFGLVQQTDNLSTLKDLAELIKDPKAIIEAHETARKQMALTEAEITKVEEARNFIKEYTKLSEDLKKQQANLDFSRAQHEQVITEFDIKTSNISQQLNDREEQIAKKEAQLAASQKQLAEDQKTLTDAQHNLTRTHYEAMRKVQKAAEDNEIVKKVLDEKANRLAEHEINLKAKAKKIKEQASEL